MDALEVSQGSWCLLQDKWWWRSTQSPHCECATVFRLAPRPLISYGERDRPEHVPLGICEKNTRQGPRSDFLNRPPWRKFDCRCLASVTAHV